VCVTLRSPQRRIAETKITPSILQRCLISFPSPGSGGTTRIVQMAANAGRGGGTARVNRLVDACTIRKHLFPQHVSSELRGWLGVPVEFQVCESGRGGRRVRNGRVWRSSRRLWRRLWLDVRACFELRYVARLVQSFWGGFDHGWR
jgi:hypothetical protein